MRDSKGLVNTEASTLLNVWCEILGGVEEKGAHELQLVEAGRFTQRDPLWFVGEPSAYSYAVNQPLLYTDASGYKASAKDWVKKAIKCARKASSKCSTVKGPKDFEKCYWAEFAKCMGKSWTKTTCVDYYCWLWPNDEVCKKSNPCDVKNPDVVDCQHCCDIKYSCCMIHEIMNPTGPRQCQLEHDHCFEKCDLCALH